VQEADSAPDARFAALYEPEEPVIDLVEWIGQRQSSITQALRDVGSVLLRNLGITSQDAFRALASTFMRELVSYREQSSPRTSVGDHIYTSTDYPANQEIFPHNENSYSLTFPSTIAFWCHTPPSIGGETPLVDTRRVYAAIDSSIRDRFCRLGWMYLRNFGDGLGLPWQRVFQTDDPNEVEAYCERAEIQCVWKPGGHLRTTQVRPAVIAHPLTGEISWFNHVTFFHVSMLPKAARETLRSEFCETDLPNNTFFGDGSPIPDEVIGHLREVYQQHMVRTSWNIGDLLLVDNIAKAHGRRPFVGPRRILVAMGDAFTRTDRVAVAGWYDTGDR
jgi:alpha-ketoglutarate-dependent taurine dioxygenase